MWYWNNDYLVLRRRTRNSWCAMFWRLRRTRFHLTRDGRTSKGPSICRNIPPRRSRLKSQDRNDDFMKILCSIGRRERKTKPAFDVNTAHDESSMDDSPSVDEFRDFFREYVPLSFGRVYRAHKIANSSLHRLWPARWYADVSTSWFQVDCRSMSSTTRLLSSTRNTGHSDVHDLQRVHAANCIVVRCSTYTRTRVKRTWRC